MKLQMSRSIRRELFAVALSSLGMAMVAPLLAKGAAALLYTRFWMDHRTLLQIGWCIDGFLGVCVLEYVRRSAPTWPLFKAAWRGQATYFGATLVSMFALGHLVAFCTGTHANATAVTPSEAAAASIFNLLTGAAWEELIFRYHLQSVISRLTGSTILGISVSAMLFVVGHPGVDAPAIFACAVWLGLIVVRTQSVWPAVAAHLALNFASQVMFGNSTMRTAPIYSNEVFDPLLHVAPFAFLISTAWLLYRSRNRFDEDCVVRLFKAIMPRRFAGASASS